MKVMLATAGTDLATDPLKVIELLEAQDPAWCYEIKWDGVRCVSRIEDGEVLLTNRNGVDITGRYPEVALELRDGFPTGDWTLDGELVAFRDGRPSFELLSRRDRLKSPDKIKEALRVVPVTYVLFDCMEADGVDLRKHVLEARRLLLDQAFRELSVSTKLQISATGDPHVMWEFVQANGLEGLVAKNRFSVYVNGRSGSWIKIKRGETGLFLATAYEAGKGKYEGALGALYISELQGDQLVPVGKVGTGFTDTQRVDLRALFDDGATKRLLIRASYMERTSTGQLRFPAFKGVVNDMTITEYLNGGAA